MTFQLKNVFRTTTEKQRYCLYKIMRSLIFEFPEQENKIIKAANNIGIQNGFKTAYHLIRKWNSIVTDGLAGYLPIWLKYGKLAGEELKTQKK
ncbi:hypothetical protein CL633_04495 [bacterium]|jgi:hypothetical protein|nr:hypothetical protein [bacterium]|tara:strand:+ start:510 stop:788 length:279 start_codon:yes stop_codon:yes gene_type:complete